MNNIVKNSAHLLSANVIAQVIGLIVYPILTRLYTPEDFGLLNLFLSIGGILTILSTAEYHNAIVLTGEDQQSRNVFQAGGTLLLGMIIVLVLTIPFSQPIAHLFKAPMLAKWYWILPLYVLAMGGWNLLNYYAIYRKQFGHIAGYQLSQSVLAAGIKVGAGYGGFLSGGLIVGSVMAPIVSGIGTWMRMGQDKWQLVRGYQFSRVKQAMREFRKFPLFSMPKSLVNTLSSNLPVLLLTPFFGLTEIGFFTMAMTLGFRPLNMISNAIYQTFFQTISHRVNHAESILSYYRTFIFKSLLIVLPSFILLYVLLPDMVTLLLGNNWAYTATYLRIMLPWLALVVIGASVSFVPDIFGQQAKGFVIELIYLLLRVIAIVIGIWNHNIQLTIAGYTLVGIVVIGYQLIWYYRMIMHYEKRLV